MCLSHTENAQARRLWWVLTGGTLLLVILLPIEKNLILSVLASVVMIAAHFLAGLAEMWGYDESVEE